MKEVVPLEEPPRSKCDFRPLLFHISMTTLILLTYVPMKMILPLYNKILFNGLGTPFHFPISCSCIQIFFVSILLFFCNGLLKISSGECSIQNKSVNFKKAGKMVLRMVPIAVCLSLAFVLTNIGIDKVNVNIHVLLKTTKIFWVLIFSFFISEKIGLFDLVVVLFIISGGILISLDVSLGWSSSEKNVLGVVVNLLSPFFDALILILLRTLIKYLKREASVIHLTYLQLSLAFFFMLIPALFVETILQAPHTSFFYVLFRSGSGATDTLIALLFIGVCITMLFHLSQVALTVYENVLTQAIIGQWIILPQLILFTVLEVVLPQQWNLTTFKMTSVHISGAVLIVVGSTLAGVQNFCAKLAENGIVKPMRGKYARLWNCVCGGEHLGIFRKKDKIENALDVKAINVSE